MCQKVLNMNFELITKKNNALTDGTIPQRKVIANKLLNVINYYYEKQGSSFKIAINELLETMNMTVNSGKSKEMLADGISMLQQPIQLRNFQYKGRGIKWISAPFLSKATIFTDDKLYVHIELTDEILEGLKQKQHFTPIDIKISNQFKTKYGIVLWEMYLRYKNQRRQGGGDYVTYQEKTLDELNQKFATNYKKPSEMKRCINRGLNEIKKITGKTILVNYEKDIKKFHFFWEIEEKSYKNDFKLFKKYMIENHKNEYLTNVTFESGVGKVTCKIVIDEFGYLADASNNIGITNQVANEIWKYLFKHQNELSCFKYKQDTLF